MAEIMDLAILNGKVVIPDDGVYPLNVYVKDGKIKTLSAEVLPARETVDAAGKYVAPGIIDPHIHLGLFAPLKTELGTETRAALISGTTTQGVFFGGPQSHLESFPAVRADINAHSFTDIIPHLVIGTDQQLAELTRYAREFEVASFKIYMNGIPGLIPNVSDGFIMDVLAEMKKTGKPCILCSHTENASLVARAVRLLRETKGEQITVADWTLTHPEIVETEAVDRLAHLAAEARCPVYIVHLTAAASVRRLKELRLGNPYVSVETTSPYLSIRHTDSLGGAIKMEPPFRTQQDLDGLWQGIAEGVIDTIGTDNVTMTIAEKNMNAANVWEVLPGYAASEHHLSVALDEGVHQRRLPLERVLACMTKNPARKFGLYPRKGSLLPGSDADIVLIDLEREKKVTAAATHTRSDFSIYEGRVFKGWGVMTIKGGRIVAKDGALVDEQPRGVCLRR
ncbi:MAG: amidohydrolase family protein [Gracilibacteraceae bacterium]|nr:amidohydrolase family protein [Gracilibacteraceae bacterium]